MSDTPKALVIRTAGTNCDAEMVRAFQLAGAAPDLVHLDRLIADPARIDRFDLIGLPGGFSYCCAILADGQPGNLAPGPGMESDRRV